MSYRDDLPEIDCEIGVDVMEPPEFSPSSISRFPLSPHGQPVIPIPNPSCSISPNTCSP